MPVPDDASGTGDPPLFTSVTGADAADGTARRDTTAYEPVPTPRAVTRTSHVPATDAVVDTVSVPDAFCPDTATVPSGATNSTCISGHDTVHEP